jgi:lysophospholipase L1-like esterase
MKKVKKIFLYSLILLISFEISLHALGFVSKYLSGPKKQVQDSNYAKILVLGESTSYGLLLKDRKASSYPSLLEGLINDGDFPKKVDVINVSTPGIVSDSINHSLERNLETYKPDLVICHFGVNDSNPALNPFLEQTIFGVKVPWGLTKVKTLKLIMLGGMYLKNRENIKVGNDGHFVFHNEQNKKAKKDHIYFERTIHNYQSVIDKLNQKKIPFIMISYFDAPLEFYKLLDDLSTKNKAHYVNMRINEDKKTSKLYANDLWHPSEQGHKYMAKKLYKYINSRKNDFFR